MYIVLFLNMEKMINNLQLNDSLKELFYETHL